MTGEEQAVKMAEMEHRAKSNTRRIDKLEQATDALNSLATSVELMVAEQRHQTEAMLGIRADVAKLDGKVEQLESKPGRRWEVLAEKALTVIAAALIGFLLAGLGLPA